MATKAETARLAAISAAGCVLCRYLGHGHTPGVELHHIRRNGGKRDLVPIIPLCHVHHRTGGYGVAVHAGRKEWEKRQGVTEQQLLEMEVGDEVR